MNLEPAISLLLELSQIKNADVSGVIYYSNDETKVRAEFVFEPNDYFSVLREANAASKRWGTIISVKNEGNAVVFIIKV